jgi:hypothetical protein
MNIEWSTVNELCDVVRENSFAIHKYLRHGHMEMLYVKKYVFTLNDDYDSL